MSLDELKADIMSYVPPVSGVTFCGGEPSMQMEEVEALAKWAKSKGLRTTLYTGHQIGELKLQEDAPFDYVIDGAFEIKKKSGDCAFRGSYNQMIWKKINGEYEPIQIADDGKEFPAL